MRSSRGMGPKLDQHRGRYFSAPQPYFRFKPALYSTLRFLPSPSVVSGRSEDASLAGPRHCRVRTSATLAPSRAPSTGQAGRLSHWAASRRASRQGGAVNAHEGSEVDLQLLLVTLPDHDARPITLTNFSFRFTVTLSYLPCFSRTPIPEIISCSLPTPQRGFQKQSKNPFLWL